MSTLSSLVFLDPVRQPEWLALKGALKHSKDSLTRKLRQEVTDSEALKPAATVGQVAKVQAIKYNSFYELFLKRAPILLQTFDTASDAVLRFLTELEGTQDEAANKDKIKTCVKWMKYEEKKYRAEYSTLYDTILTSYLSHGAGSSYGTSIPIPVSGGTELLANNTYRN